MEKKNFIYLPRNNHAPKRERALRWEEVKNKTIFQQNLHHLKERPDQH